MSGAVPVLLSAVFGCLQVAGEEEEGEGGAVDLGHQDFTTAHDINLRESGNQPASQPACR
jgi:hypothetical protein